MLSMTKTLSHQLLGSIDTIYQEFINTQMESSSKQWTEIQSHVSSDREVLQRVQGQSLIQFTPYNVPRLHKHLDLEI